MAATTDNWQPLKRLRTHEQVLEAIETQIVRGRLRSGDRLPSERELAEALGVSRPSVREALRILESMGVIAAGVGSGKNAGSIFADRVGDALTRVLQVHLALANFGLDDVVATLCALEAEAVVGAAEHATDGDLQLLTDVVDRMKPDGASLTPGEINELHTEFHVQLAEASGNRLLGEMVRAIRALVNQEMVRASEGVDDWHVDAERIHAEHRTILERLLARDAAGARTAMAGHILGLYGEAGTGD